MKYHPHVTTPQVPRPEDMKGKLKWASDGFQKLRGHVGEEDAEMLDKYKDAIMVDPKLSNLLITASNYEPGSKPLDQIMAHVKNLLGEK